MTSTSTGRCSCCYRRSTSTAGSSCRRRRRHRRRPRQARLPDDHSELPQATVEAGNIRTAGKERARRRRTGASACRSDHPPDLAYFGRSRGNALVTWSQSRIARLTAASLRKRAPVPAWARQSADLPAESSWRRGDEVLCRQTADRTRRSRSSPRIAGVVHDDGDGALLTGNAAPRRGDRPVLLGGCRHRRSPRCPSMERPCRA